MVPPQPPAIAATLSWRQRAQINLARRQHADHLLTSVLLAWIGIVGPLDLSAGTSDVITIIITVMRGVILIVFFAEEGLL